MCLPRIMGNSEQPAGEANLKYFRFSTTLTLKVLLPANEHLQVAQYTLSLERAFSMSATINNERTPLTRDGSCRPEHASSPSGDDQDSASTLDDGARGYNVSFPSLDAGAGDPRSGASMRSVIAVLLFGIIHSITESGTKNLLISFSYRRVRI